MVGTERVDARLETDRRRLPPEERQQQIVDEAVRFFAEVGLDGKTRELAKRLGVTQSLIFKYFETKQDLIEAVYARVYLERISPDWPALIGDRSRPIGERMSIFYRDYGSRIFDHDWMRIFMFSGLAGAELNKRYLNHLSKTLLEPILQEVRIAAPDAADPTLEDLWSLHGGIVYLGIRQHIYQMPVPDDPQHEIDRAIARFLRSFDIEGPYPTAASRG
ncbi:TetR/AcrR family transcriptional regulator [Aurantimonas sp. VKM B-3413]|uniref:TetR/AcrR family transcriptional regulator n=1 Tax=Aurantimonas sp. VKM B-3413 TaxID=2779401 RepID=UPI001E29E72B|nr:TetR/AcrR family transcriptional regulator [Aurantimonas sp. VKM B-3413]MCB8836338.1 TetR/AcrR family transcriptional regulator [Aurantimonas sp. VKM B-3413]